MSKEPIESDSLYASADPIFPRKVKGPFRTAKWWILGVTMVVYHLLPFLRWDRGPEMPNQALLIDLAHRRFYMFSIEIWPQEFYFVAGLLIMAGLGLFLATSATGRAWCGYACPQTVWSDLFYAVESVIEGDRNKRMRLYKQDMNLHKFTLRSIKYISWALIGLAFGLGWVLYFADAPTLLVAIFTGTAPFVAYGFIFSLGFTTFVFAGILREQICTYMCPWPRIQAAMIDEDTLTIGYRDWRGEPRGKHRKAEGAENLGDCIDCNACFAVCPVGIDIRDGQQLECTTCGLCIDACDDMMTKIGKPRGLVDYLTAADEERERAGHPPRPAWKHLVRPRTIMYLTIWTLVGAALLVALIIRPSIGINVSPIRDPQYIALSDGSIRNDYDVRFRNMNGEPRTFRVYTVTEDGEEFTIEMQGVDGNEVVVPTDATHSLRFHIFASADQEAASEDRTEVVIWIEDLTSGEKASAETVFNGVDR